MKTQKSIVFDDQPILAIFIFKFHGQFEKKSKPQPHLLHIPFVFLIITNGYI